MSRTWIDGTSPFVSAANLNGMEADITSALGVPDGALASRINDTGSQARGALNAIYDRVVTATGLVGGTDVTTALQGFMTTAQTNKVPLVIPAPANGMAYKVSAILQAWSGARIFSRGAVLDFQTDHSATGRGFFIGSAAGGAGISDVQVFGLKVISTNATARNGVYGLISVFDSTDILLQDCWVGNSTAGSGGEGGGVYTQNTTDFRYVRLRVQNSLADGIHTSRGSLRGVIDHPVVIGAQDDGVSVVSNKQDGTGPIYGPCQYIEIIQPVVLNSTVLGAGVSLVGAQDCTVVGGSIDGVPDSIVVVAQANYGGIINPARNTIIGVTGTNSAKAAGALRVANADRTTIVGCELSGNVGGYSILSSTRTKVSGGGVSSTGGDMGVYADSASPRTIVTGMDLSGNGATGYKVYRGTTAGAENVLVTTLGQDVLTYTDTGSAGSAATLPASDTAGLTMSTVTLGTTATTGGTFTAGTYYWKVTAIDSKGESLGSNEVTATLAANGTQVLNWGAVINAYLLQGAGSVQSGNITT